MLPVTELDVEITATIRRGTAKLAAFVKRRVLDVTRVPRGAITLRRADGSV